MTPTPSTTIGTVIAAVIDLQRVMDGRVFNSTTGQWEAASDATRAASAAAISASIRAVVDTITFPLNLGALGVLDRARFDTALDAIQAALSDYVQATTKP